MKLCTMFKTLFGKISLTLFLLFIGLGTGLVLVVDFSSKALQEEATQKLHLELAKNIVKDAPLLNSDGQQNENIGQAFHTMMLLGPAIELYLLAPDGRILSYDAPEEKIKRQFVDMSPIQSLLNDNARLPIRGDDPRSESHRKIFSAAPVYLPGFEGSFDSIAGYLYIIIGGEDYDSVVSMLDSDRLVSFSMSTLTTGGIFLLSVLLLLYSFLTRPIRQFSDTVNTFRESNFTKAPESLAGYKIGDKNELNHLFAVFYEMAEKVESQFDELLKNRKLRQELITHVSHDLRTPLAGLRGYLETWQIKHQNASKEETLQFIDSAIKNCDQLRVLVDELFELSRLDGNDIKPELESFHLPELVDDIMQKLRIKAEQKNIQLDCSGSSNLPFVYADIAQIDRVFTNLLENAIRHTPENGAIHVILGLTDGEDKVTIKVSDNGCGIRKEELAHLFEPYYQGSNNKSERTHGNNGLGLAISKRLLNLHETDLSVESILGKGTSFAFILPAWQMP